MIVSYVRRRRIPAPTGTPLVLLAPAILSQEGHSTDTVIAAAFTSCVSSFFSLRFSSSSLSQRRFRCSWSASICLIFVLARLFWNHTSTCRGRMQSRSARSCFCACNSPRRSIKSQHKLLKPHAICVRIRSVTVCRVLRSLKLSSSSRTCSLVSLSFFLLAQVAVCASLLQLLVAFPLTTSSSSSSSSLINRTGNRASKCSVAVGLPAPFGPQQLPIPSASLVLHSSSSSRSMN